jgi:histidinol-phosphate aminotransferase
VSVFWNKRTAGLSPYVPGEQPKDRKFIKLNTNENPYPPSPKVAEAIRRLVTENGGQAAGESLRLYPDPVCAEFREAAAAAYGVQPENVFPANGSDEALAFAFGALFESGAAGGGRAVLFPDITYSFYPVYATLWDIPFQTVPLTGDFAVRPQDYRVPSLGVILPNPNAPTGRALPAAALEEIAAYQLEHNKVLIADEAYTAFGAESAVPLTARYPNLLTVHTLSKSASLAGLRAGFAIGSAALVEGLFRVRDSFNSYTMDRLALAGASAALADKAYYDEVNQKVIATRERTAAELVRMGFEVIPSKANFLFIRYGGGPVSKPEPPECGLYPPAPPRSEPAVLRSPPGEAGVERNKRGALTGAALFQALRNRGILVRHFNKPRIEDYLRVSIGTDAGMDAFLSACAEIITEQNDAGERA